MWHDAFISYSRKDEAFAAQLEKALEAFTPPKGLGLPNRHLDVFRDKEDFTGSEYHSALDKHINNSAKLIVVCSPNARNSEYVNDEIRRFVQARNAQHIISILLAGIPNNEATPESQAQMAFPEALCEAMQVPLAADYRNFDPKRSKVNHGIYEASWYTILANLYELRRAEIEQRDKKRRVRQRIIPAATVATLIIALSAGTYMLRNQQIAEDAAAMWHPLDFANPESELWRPLDFNKLPPDSKQSEFLLRLAHSDDAHKKAFLNQLLNDDKLIAWFNVQHKAIIRSAVGLSLERRDWFAERLKSSIPYNAAQERLGAKVMGLIDLNIPQNAEDYIAAIKATSNRDQLEALRQGLAEAATEIPQAQAAGIAAQWVREIQATTDYEQPYALGGGLETLINRMTEVEARSLAEQLAAVLSSSVREDQANVLVRRGLAPLAAKLSGTDAAGLVVSWLEIIKIPTFSAVLDAMGGSLAVLTAKVPESEASKLAGQFTAHIKGMSESSQVEVLGKGLAALASRVPETEATGLAEQWVAIIQATDSGDTYRLAALGQGLEAIAFKVPEADAEALAERWLTAIKATAEPFLREALGKGLAALATRIPEARAAIVAEKWVAAIEATTNEREVNQADSYEITALGNSLAAVARKVPESQATELATRWVASVKIATDYDQLEALGQGLAAVVSTVPEAQAADLVGQWMSIINSAIADDSQASAWRIRAISAGLAALVAKVPETQAASLATTLTEPIVSALTALKDDNVFENLGQSLVRFAGRVPETQATSLAEQWIAAIDASTDYAVCRYLGQGLAALAAKISEAKAKDLADKLSAEIEATAGYPQQVGALVQGLAALASRVPAEQAADLAKYWVAAAKATDGADELDALQQGLATLGAKVSESQAAALATQWLPMVNAWAATDSGYLSRQLAVMGDGLSALASKMPPDQAADFAEQWMTVIETKAREYQLGYLGHYLAARLGNAGDHRAMQRLLEPLKNPLLPDSPLTDAIRKHYRGAPSEEQGLWALIEWAHQRFPKLDLDAPLM